jgi:saccharopine dehydrogenase (NAD+, L-lysine-forming)
MSEGKERLGALEPYPNEDELVTEVKSKFAAVEEKLGRPVRALVIGSLGRCGRGAVQFFQKAGIKDENICQWDMRETEKGGPFQEIIDGKSIVTGHCANMQSLFSFIFTISLLCLGLRAFISMTCLLCHVVQRRPLGLVPLSRCFLSCPDGVSGPPG